MLKGKNILWGTALYLGAIWGLYNQKKITFKDKAELEQAVGQIAVRKGATKDTWGTIRTEQMRRKEEANPTMKLTAEFKKSYGEQKWVR